MNFSLNNIFFLTNIRLIFNMIYVLAAEAWQHI